MQRTLKRELKVLEIVKREAFEAPIRSFFLLKSQRTPRKIQLIPHLRRRKAFSLARGEGFQRPNKKGARGEEGQPFFSLVSLLW
jgi:hypothetical protein